MSTSNHALGLLGGTFDPIHNGHLHIAMHAYNTLPLSAVKLMPCYQPVHKKPTQANSGDRLSMLALAIEAHPMLSVELYEINTQKPCYTVDTLRHLNAAQPHQPMCFLLGMDAFLSLPQWHQWQQLTCYAHLVVLSRPGYAYASGDLNTQLQTWLQPHLTQTKAAITRPITDAASGLVLFHPLPENPLAASMLRARIQRGESCEKDLPSGVGDYILHHQLYK